ncbi:MAG: hypothetical protein ACFNP4_06780 [Capnocytophaga gingivalis]|jgi:hypothetical protein|uniref:hypothetical protein n=1 Tax=Capnocytophaga gingivalis TaxID=1017 RepID=UPI00361F7C8B
MDNRQVQLERANHVLTAMGVDTRNAKVMDRTQYLTFDGKGKSSVVYLIDSNTKKLVGDTSFDANKFNKGRYFVIDGIRVLTEDKASSLHESNWKSAPNSAILNSELKISQDEDLLVLPVSDLVYTKISVGEDNGFRSIASAPVIVPEKEINFSWQFPQGASVPSDQTQFVRIELRGFEFFTN